MKNGSETTGAENSGIEYWNLGDLEISTWSWWTKCSNMWSCNQISLSSYETLTPCTIVLVI